jgi:hypothetical protein
VLLKLLQDLGAIFFAFVLGGRIGSGTCFFFLVVICCVISFRLLPYQTPFLFFFSSCLPPSLSGVSSALLCVCVCVCTERLWLSLRLFFLGTDLGACKPSSYINFFGSQSYKTIQIQRRTGGFGQEHIISFFLVLLLDGVLQRK